MKKKTQIGGIFSIMPQVGKTTEGINTIKINRTDDHIFLTHDLNSVLEDFIRKCVKVGIYPELLSDKISNQKKRADNLLRTPRESWILAGLGNISQLEQAERLFFSGNLSGIKQHLHIDEIHKFCLEFWSKKAIKRDSWLQIAIAANLVDNIWMYSASGHDILMAPYITFDSCKIIEPYLGYRGFESAVFHIKSQGFFDRARDAHKHGDRPPVDFIDFILEYLSMMVNISTKNSFHDWLAHHVPEYKQYNQKFKNDSEYLVGGLGLGMSSSFGSNMVMFNRRSNSHVALKWQAFGRAYGPIPPHICCTAKDKAEMDNYYENMQKLVSEEIIMLPGKERAKYAESLIWTNPRNVPNPKLHRDFKIVKRNKEGSTDNVVEDYHSIYVGTELAPGDKEWRNNQAPAKKILKMFLDQNPDIELPFNYSMKGIQDREELTKFRQGERIPDIRIGQNYSKPGEAYVIIRRGNYEGTYSFYNYDGALLSSEEITEGTIHVKTENRSAA